MAFKIDKDGNISMIQGDSGIISVRGLNPEKNYSIYLAITDKNRKRIGQELSVNSNNSSSVMFQLTGSFTDLLSVKKDEDYAIYYYGLKICDLSTNIEDTLIIESGDIGSVNTITVYPKKVEGI